MFKKLDPLASFFLNDDENLESQLDAMRKLKRDYGIRRFLIPGPGLQKRIMGYLTLEDYEQVGETLKFINQTLGEEGIVAGWWCFPCLRCGDSKTFQHIVSLDGSQATEAMCPLDAGFAADLLGKIRRVTEIAKPPLIQIEDDFELTSADRNGCFCDAHLAEFARRSGRFYTREELKEIFGVVTDESIRLRKLFSEMSRDTLADFATKIRATVDDVCPETRIIQCQPGTTDIDGFTAPAVASALAGPNTRPGVRIFGTTYFGRDDFRYIPGYLFHAMYSVSHLPESFELFHETDTCPSTRFFCSAKWTKNLLFCAFACGADETFFLGMQIYIDNQLEDEGYYAMLERNRPRFDAYRAALDGTVCEGVEIIYRPDSLCAVPIKGTEVPFWPAGAASLVFGRMGIPYSTNDMPVKLLFGKNAIVMSDDELRELLKGRLLIDGEAAIELSRRGFAADIGVTANPMTKDSLRSIAKERLRDDTEGGRYIQVLACLHIEGETYAMAELVPQGAEIASDFCNTNSNIISPAQTFFINARGGRIAVMAMGLSYNETTTLFNYRKQQLLVRTLQWLSEGVGGVPVTLTGAPNFYCGWNTSRDRSQAVLLVVNFGGDDFCPQITLDEEWRDCTIHELDNDGVWHPVNELSGVFQSAEPRIFSFSK